MPDFQSLFGRGAGDADSTFDDPGSYVPEHLPDPGPFLEDATVLTGEDHVAAHRTAHDLFEERGVYDATFGYNLARLDLDHRHPGAGFRYAEEDSGALRVEFTPTTPFCPQSHSLTVGAFRAWNGLADRHDYGVVRVRLAPMHQRSGAVNDELLALEETFRETGSVEPGDGSGAPG